ncbi:M15 family metallopeptidase [Gulbenkiania mobilis]|uniref:D-alanyl-D-alanine carboxypeptidase n=1 Tax=Gulbenkiania mobilis TaxID=397457 RepID=A0ABY2CZS3_GULMO|nr:M15 family metallopeptidase [Gulbenkiania mobilis]TCW33559.1 D-alanyl-D-alanine carboxypeptidase [Gulbenkiania mobilis]
MSPIPDEIARCNARLGIPLARLRARGVPFCPEAASTELVTADTGADGRVFQLLPEAATAWQAMKAAAAADGVGLFLVSAFRSVARQQEIVTAKLARGQALEDILRVSAAPGFSEHHGGRAIDIGTPGSPLLEEVFETTAAFAWLCRHAGRFGFAMSYPRDNPQGFLYEPWHWCHRPGACA